VTLYDYQDGVGFYENLRPFLIGKTGASRIYAKGASIVSNSGLSHFLNKFRKKGTALSRNYTVEPKQELTLRQELPYDDGQELIQILAGIMSSIGEFDGAPKHKNNHRAPFQKGSPIRKAVLDTPSL